MIRPILITLIIPIFFACMTKKETKQWNLNKTVGWKSLNPLDFSVLFIKTNKLAADSANLSIKRKFDEAVLKELKSNKLGDQVENDDSNETDFHFMVSKDYQKAVAIIISVAKTYNLQLEISIYQRDYKSFDKWTDKLIYPN